VAVRPVRLQATSHDRRHFELPGNPVVDITFLVALPKSKANMGWPFMIMAGDCSIADVRLA
jgi:hypothetical protein